MVGMGAFPIQGGAQDETKVWPHIFGMSYMTTFSSHLRGDSVFTVQLECVIVLDETQIM